MSNAGAPTHPFWYRNVVADPLVELQDGAVKQMRAREVFGEKKDEWWKRAEAAYSEFPAYEPAQAAKLRCSSWSPSRLNDLRT